MLNRLKEILSNYTEIPPEEIRPESGIRDFGLTSYDVINIVADCEEEFGIVIPDSEIHTLLTVNDILLFLETRQNADADTES